MAERLLSRCCGVLWGSGMSKLGGKQKFRISSFASRKGIAAILLMMGLAISGCQASSEDPSQAQVQSWEDTIESAAQIVESIKCFVPAPLWYKNLWLDINASENELGRSLMSHYMGCRGTTFQLSEQEFKKLPLQLVAMELASPWFAKEFIEDPKPFLNDAEGDIIDTLDEAVLVATHVGNTLGHFQLELKGVLKWKRHFSGKLLPHFEGKARVKDRYDFNPSESDAKESWRGRDTELRVRIAHVGMPGKAFEVISDWMNFSFDYPRYSGDLIQEGENSGKSGYSSYGEELQLILMTELRSEKWNKASSREKLGILVTTMKRLHDASKRRN
ncbi:MAG: hypothetical protein RI953_1972 [Pseudomonadota bacterium]|jgi:hypothetical protein